MVEQFGLAMIPFFAYRAMAWGFTSGTTSGTSGSIRQAPELSMQTAPARAAEGQNSFDRSPPAEKRAMSIPAKESWVSSSTSTAFPLNSRISPALRELARYLIFPTGKSRSSRHSIIWAPTAPVAPTIATFHSLLMCLFSSETTPKMKSAPQKGRLYNKPRERDFSKGAFSPLPLHQDAQHPPQRLRRAPQELVAAGESLEVVRPHLHLAHPADGDSECPGNRRRRELRQGVGLGVGDEFYPLVVVRDQPFDLGNRHVPVQLDGQGLAMAAHSTDPHADAVHRDRRRGTEDLVGLGKPLPLLAALAVLDLPVDPGQDIPRQGGAEFLGRHDVAPQGGSDLTVDLQDGRTGILQLFGHHAVQDPHLGEELAHVGGAGAAGSLVGHGGKPLHQSGTEQPPQGHQHQAHGAVAANEVLLPLGQCSIDNVAVDRVEDDDRIRLHSQTAGGVDPVPLPPLLAQLGV